MGGLPELVTNGKNGYVFDLDREADLENTLQLLIHQYKNIKFNFDVDKFKVNKITRKYLDVYKQLLEES